MEDLKIFDKNGKALNIADVSGSASINIEKYRGISELEFEMTSRINQVWQRRKLVAEQIVKEDIRENQMLYAAEEIKYLDNILKKFLFID